MNHEPVKKWVGPMYDICEVVVIASDPSGLTV